MHNTRTKKLTRTWSPLFFWFGIIGFFLIACRAEGISYLSMRFWWVLWIGAGVLFFLFQYKQYVTRNYEVIPKESADDPRGKYLPKKKR